MIRLPERKEFRRITTVDIDVIIDRRDMMQGQREYVINLAAHMLVAYLYEQQLTKYDEIASLLNYRSKGAIAHSLKRHYQLLRTNAVYRKIYEEVRAIPLETPQ